MPLDPPARYFGPHNQPAATAAAARRTGTRAKLATRFFQDLYAAWEERGDAVIRQVAFHDPAKFLAVVAHVMPQKIDVTHSTDGLSDERMEQLIELASAMAAGAVPARLEGYSGEGAPGVQLIEGQVVGEGGGGRAGVGPPGGEIVPSHTADPLLADQANSTGQDQTPVQNFSAEIGTTPPISRVAEELQFPIDPLGVDPLSLF
jgi:hypothetical protein